MLTLFRLKRFLDAFTQRRWLVLHLSLLTRLVHLYYTHLASPPVRGACAGARPPTNAGTSDRDRHLSSEGGPTGSSPLPEWDALFGLHLRDLMHKRPLFQAPYLGVKFTSSTKAMLTMRGVTMTVQGAVDAEHLAKRRAGEVGGRRLFVLFPGGVHLKISVKRSVVVRMESEEFVCSEVCWWRGTPLVVSRIYSRTSAAIEYSSSSHSLF